MKEVTSPVAVITLTDVDAGSATGNVVRGSGLMVGDNVKKLSTSIDVSAVLLTPVNASSASTGAGIQKTNSANVGGTKIQ